MPDLLKRMSERTALLLQGLGLNPREVGEELSRRSVLISLTWAHSEEGQAILALSLELLLRLGIYCPQIHVHLPDGVPRLHRSPLLGEGEDLKSSLMRMAQSLNPDKLRFIIGRQPRFEPDVALNIGNGGGNALGRRTLYVSSDGWLSRVSSRPEPLPSDHTTTNQIGACLAAVLGANEVWKSLMWEFLKERPEFRRLDSLLVFSAFDYSLNSQQASNPLLPDPINLGSLILIGLGGIGSSFIASLISLASSHRVYGRLTLVDPDIFNWTDANRHLLWSPEEVGSPKVLRAKRLLENVPGLEVQARLAHYQEVLSSIDDETLVIIGVDNEESREAIQYRHRHILLGGYRELSSIIARIYIPHTACLGCLSALGLTGNPVDPTPSIGFSSALSGLLLLGEVVKERYFCHLDPPLNVERNVLIIALEGTPHEGSLLSAPKVRGCSLCEHTEELVVGSGQGGTAQRRAHER